MTDNFYKQFNSTQEAVDSLQESMIDKLPEADGFMVAVWTIDGDTINYRGKVTRRFPKVDYVHAIRHFADDCTDEITAEQAPPPPLPTAAFLRKDNAVDAE